VVVVTTLVGFPFPAGGGGGASIFPLKDFRAARVGFAAGFVAASGFTGAVGLSVFVVLAAGFLATDFVVAGFFAAAGFAGSLEVELDEAALLALDLAAGFFAA